METSAAAVSAVSARQHVLRIGATCADVDAAFSDDRGRSSVLVALPDGECLLVDRRAFYEQMSGPLGYGRTLHFRDPVSAVIEPSQLVVAADDPLDSAALRAATSDAGRRCADVLVRYPTGWGTASLDRLLHHLRDLVHDRAAELDRVLGSLRDLASRDALTGVANRAHLFERTAEALASVEHGSAVSFVHCGVDLFKAINDTLGHATGDDLLVAIARRLESVAGAMDLVARTGGDEFVVLTADGRTGIGARGLAERVLGAFARPFDIAGHVVGVRASIGVVTAGAASDPSTMLSEADDAMRAAKAAGGARVVRFGGVDDERSRRARVVACDLRTAAARDQLHLVFQPIVRTGSGEVAGVEALLRWEHPELGPVPPNEFIPIAEAQGLIGRIGHWVLETACRTLATWDECGAAPAWVAVNVSAFQLDDVDLAASVAECLRRNGLRPEQLHVELTESVMATGDANRLHQLRELRDLGVAISLDDFGTGSRR